VYYLVVTKLRTQLLSITGQETHDLIISQNSVSCEGMWPCSCQKKEAEKINCVMKLIQLSLCKSSRHVGKMRYSSIYSQPWRLIELSDQFNALSTLHPSFHWTACWSGCFQEQIHPSHLNNKVHTKQNTAWLTTHTVWWIEVMHVQYTFWNFSLLVCVAVCSTMRQWTTRSLSK